PCFRDLHEVAQSCAGPTVFLGDADLGPTSFGDIPPVQGKLALDIVDKGPSGQAFTRDLTQCRGHLGSELRCLKILFNGGHFGSPDTRSLMMLRWISEVPE